jgi:hypothetical protein
MQYLFIYCCQRSFKNDDEQHKDFLQDLGLLIVKNQLPL